MMVALWRNLLSNHVRCPNLVPENPDADAQRNGTPLAHRRWLHKAKDTADLGCIGEQEE